MKCTRYFLCFFGRREEENDVGRFVNWFLGCWQYTLAMVGYGDDEMNTTVLELTYNYGVTEYTKGDGYGQVRPTPLLLRIVLLLKNHRVLM